MANIERNDPGSSHGGSSHGCSFDTVNGNTRANYHSDEEAFLSDEGQDELVPVENIATIKLVADKIAHVLESAKVNVHVVLTLFWPNLLMSLWIVKTVLHISSLGHLE